MTRPTTTCAPISGNRLLDALPVAELERLSAHLERVPMALGAAVYEPGEQLRHAYFPTSATISMHHVLASGASAEIVGVGNEGVVGIALLTGGDTTSSSATVQIAGAAYRIERRVLRQEFDRGEIVQRLLLRYLQVLLTQVAQTAACYRHHSVQQQLCRWLLRALDRAPSGELVMTQELAANMLGVRRESITDAAGKLQAAGGIQYRRGHITVLDRSLLEARSCECYCVVKRELQRLFAISPC